MNIYLYPFYWNTLTYLSHFDPFFWLCFWATKKRCSLGPLAMMLAAICPINATRSGQRTSWKQVGKQTSVPVHSNTPTVAKTRLQPADWYRSDLAAYGDPNRLPSVNWQLATGSKTAEERKRRGGGSLCGYRDMWTDIYVYIYIDKEGQPLAEWLGDIPLQLSVGWSQPRVTAWGLSPSRRHQMIKSGSEKIDSRQMRPSTWCRLARSAL